MSVDVLSIDGATSTTSSTLAVELAEALSLSECGNKAANLARLLHLGIPVPRGVVVTDTAIERFLDVGALREPIAGLCRGLESQGDPGVRCASQTIQSLLFSTAMPPDLGEAIEEAARTIGIGPYIVRSSARGEDAVGASFAGQLDSVADVLPGHLLEAVVEVWASRWSERALAYSIAKGVSLDGMGVVIQQQVASRWSGVLFTESPSDRTRMLVEFCSGMGAALVSGRSNPGRLTIRREDLRAHLEAEPEDCASPLSSFVDDHHLATLGSLALRIERHFGCPQDIEWATDGSAQLWIVQSRPITVASRGTAPDAGVAPVSPTAPGGGRVVWSNANVNENFPDPISPLLYSIASPGYYHYFRNLGRSFGISRRRLEAMEEPLRHIIGVHGARMYYNLTSIHAVLRSGPGGELLASSFNQFVGSEPTDTAPAVPLARRAADRATHALELGRIVLQTTWQYLFVEQRVKRFERRIEDFAARTRPDILRDRSKQDLLEHLRGFLRIRCHQWNDAALADAGSMVCYGVLQRLLARAFPEEDQQALHNSLLKALPGLVSGQPAIELWKLADLVRSHHALSQTFVWQEPEAILRSVDEDDRFADFKNALAHFLEQWGFRCSGELMLTVPSFQEDRTPLIGLIRNYLLSHGESPLEVLRRQTAQRVADTDRVRRELRSRRVVPVVPRIVQRAIVSRVLRWTQTCICLRERARLKQALLYSRLRRIVLEIGHRLVSERRVERADDIFFLTADEIDALLSGSAMFPEGVGTLIALRRDQHAAVSQLAPPDSLALPEGEYFRPSIGAGPDSSECDDTALKGVGACGGVVTAPATVLADVRESGRLRPGDVLVTRQTDPGWGPIFPLIAGLVVERGGMLSHGAIIAREFGIPSVVGVKDATRRIAQGSIVTVDGNRGAIAIVHGLATPERGSSVR